jgi:hypothetical protein
MLGLCTHEWLADNLPALLAAGGNPALDVALWLPSLQLEGGPQLERSAELADLAAVFAGYLAARAGLPEPARSVRDIQTAQLEITLPWAADSLGLSRPRRR